MKQISNIYSYQHLESSEYFSPENFISRLNQELLAAEELLEQAKIAWNTKHTSILNSEEQKALTNLELVEPITIKQVNNAYYRLSKIHHPDKSGGDSSRFNAIKRSRDLLIQKLSKAA